MMRTALVSVLYAAAALTNAVTAATGAAVADDERSAQLHASSLRSVLQIPLLEPSDTKAITVSVKVTLDLALKLELKKYPAPVNRCKVLRDLATARAKIDELEATLADIEGGILNGLTTKKKRRALRRTKRALRILRKVVEKLEALLAKATRKPVKTALINELHYDNVGTDTGEFIEVLAQTGGCDLTGWSLVLYNGNGGKVYDTRPLDEIPVIRPSDSKFGVALVPYPTNGIQNGTPGPGDAVALVAPNGEVQDFISYEGTFTAVGGPAGGSTPKDIGVRETGTTPVGASLGRDGNFDWVVYDEASPGELNPGQ